MHSPFVFLTILIVNYLSLVAIGTINLLHNCGLISFLFLISKLLEDRFKLVAIELEKLANSNFNQSKLDQNIHNFNLIVNDLLKCDFFFSKFNFFNYHMAMFICSVSILNRLVLIFTIITIT